MNKGLSLSFKLDGTRIYAFGLALLTLCTVPLCLGLGGGFLFDDNQAIVSNKLLRVSSLFSDETINAALSFQPGHGSRPLSMLSFALHYWLGGGQPFDFKAVNIAIHAITSFILWGFARKIFLIAGNQRQTALIRGFLVAALWAGHPMQVSTVLYVVQRMQMLSTLFILCTLWAYLKMRTSRRAARWYALLALLFWGLAFASKEDAVIVPLLALCIELTVLKFGCDDLRSSRSLKMAYVLLCCLALATGLFWAAPHYWSWNTYPGRNFNSLERVLTQGRVLTMYLGQIFVPLPQNLPFHYDWLVPSRGLLSPPSTLFSLSALLGMFASAILLLTKRPLVSLGILLFLSGHLVTSSPISLELAFEHRNHFPLFGIVLAVVDGGVWISEQWKIDTRFVRATTAIALLLLGGCSAQRAYEWGDSKRFYENQVVIAPNSERAWVELCSYYYDTRTSDKDDANLHRAIATCEKASRKFVSPLLAYKIIVYKTKAEITPTSADWHTLEIALQKYPASPQLLNVVDAILWNMQKEFPMDETYLVRSLRIIATRSLLDRSQYRDVALYIFVHGSDPQDALPFLKQAVKGIPADSPFNRALFEDLRRAKLDAWIEELKVGTIPSPSSAH